MRLAIVRQSYNPYGGAERFVERALQALREAGEPLEITLIARRWHGEAHSADALLRCNPPKLGRLSRDLGFAWAVRRAIDHGRFDLVQSHERIPGCDIFRAGDGLHRTWLELRGRSLGPWGRLMQALSPWHRYTCAAEAAMLRHPRLRAVICNSRMVREDIATRFPAIAAKLHVVHNGVDLARFHPGLREQHRARLRAELGVSEATPVVVYVGSGFSRKGVPQLLAALARPELRNAELWVIGKDKDAARLQATAQQQGLKVRFPGPQQDVTPWLGAADVFALPTLYDPMPNAALEALAAGLPVLCSSTCGAAELISPGKNGTVVDALDVPGISAALASLLAAATHPDTGLALREAARASVAKLGREAMASSLIALYRSLLPQGHTQTAEAPPAD